MGANLAMCGKGYAFRNRSTKGFCREREGVALRRPSFRSCRVRAFLKQPLQIQRHEAGARRNTMASLLRSAAMPKLSRNAATNASTSPPSK